MIWKFFAAGAVGAVVGLAVGATVVASLPKVREELKKLREEDEKKAHAAKIAEESRAAAREKEELEQVAKMDGKAQILYFERRRDKEEQKRKAEAEVDRRKKARKGFGMLFIAAAALSARLSWLGLFGRQLAGSLMDIAHWMFGGSAAEAGPAAASMAA